MKDMGVVDMSKEIKAIKLRYGPEYRFNSTITNDLARIWGVAQSGYNLHGVLVNLTQEIILHIGGCQATIEYVETCTGNWLLGLHAQTSISGFGYSPSLWDHIGFTSHNHARCAAIERFITFFNDIVMSSGHYSKADVMNAQKALAVLKVGRNPQLLLFGPAGP